MSNVRRHMKSCLSWINLERVFFHEDDMNASILVPAALISSVAIGGLLVVYSALTLFARKNEHRLLNGLLALFSACLINSWWIAFFGMAIYKLFVLKEDT
jgi:hypothetical protein